jgi:hypothetical protein
MYAHRAAVQNLTSAQIHPSAAMEFNDRLPLSRRDFCISVLNVHSTKRAIFTVFKPEPRAELSLVIIRVVIETVSGEDDILGPLDHHIPVSRTIDHIAIQDHSPTIYQMDIVLLSTYQIVGNRKLSGFVIRRIVTHHKYVCATWTLDSLNRIARNRTFPDGRSLVTRIDPHISRANGILIVIVLDIVTGHLQIPDLRTLNLDSSAFAITDVRTAYYHLVKIHVVKCNAPSAIVIDMAMRDQDVSRTIVDAYAIAQSPEQNPFEGRLHCALNKKSVGLGVPSFYFQIRSDRKTLTSPHFWVEVSWISGSPVSSLDVKGRTRTSHHDLGRAHRTLDTHSPEPVQVYLDRPREEIVAPGKGEHPVPFLEGSQYCIGIVCSSVSSCAEISYITQSCHLNSNKLTHSVTKFSHEFAHLLRLD